MILGIDPGCPEVPPSSAVANPNGVCCSGAKTIPQQAGLTRADLA